ncbi:Mu transposase domain-containing protein [Anaerostipes sp. Marseille-Q3525]|uniref:Mu transposase domain-containing protein n=1 Tax=Anaerostipes sp. Marseille-Q3525 TaxID=2758418 RepID=UPI001BA8E50A|nr:hypothetical protein [Anaerostipes sp. Marseille-Q3525]MBR9962233.1 hypothetical protein [Anaerostipes sp. Marseille-Q3525]
MTHTTVKVNSSCMITYRSNQYSVPPKYLGKRLLLQVYDNYLYVYYNTELIVIHPISAKNSMIHTIIILLSVNRRSKSRQWILKRSQKKT